MTSTQFRALRPTQNRSNFVPQPLLKLENSFDSGSVLIWLFGQGKIDLLKKNEIHRPTLFFLLQLFQNFSFRMSVDLVFGRIAHLFHLIQTAAADDPDCWRLVFHSRKLSGLNPKDRQVEKRIIRLPSRASFASCKEAKCETESHPEQTFVVP